MNDSKDQLNPKAPCPGATLLDAESAVAFDEFSHAYRAYFAHGETNRRDAEVLYDLRNRWERRMGIQWTAQVKALALSAVRREQAVPA